MYKKTTLIVIFLFVSVSFYPTILTQEITNEISDDLTEITIELCGLKGTQNIKKSISKTQLNNLKEFFESMKNEESFSISKMKNKIDTLKDLDIINLQESTTIKSLFSNRIFKSIQNTSMNPSDGVEYMNNIMCFIIGQGNLPDFSSYLNILIINALFTYGEKHDLITHDPNGIPSEYELFLIAFCFFTYMYYNFKPIALFQYVSLDYYPLFLITIIILRDG